MTSDELGELLAELQAQGADTTDVEAKTAETALPKSVRETLSSFSNSAGGGVIILGVDERRGFKATGVQDPGKTQADLSSMCAEMEPPLSPVIGIHTVGDAHVIVAEVGELSAGQKPCYHRGQGIISGSYVRVGDADRRMNSYEVALMQRNAGRPRDDTAPVVDASIDEFDEQLVEVLLRRVRSNEPRVFRGRSDAESLKLLRAVVEHDGELVPTLAGWLALGSYPQGLFANLTVTFVHFPTSTPGELGAKEERYLDEQGFSGPLAQLIPDVLARLKLNMTKSAFAGKTFDHWSYPEEALRECIVNAVAHRDYADEAQGTAVQIELYPDRLVIKNPGGLFGVVHVDELGEDGISSTRNEALVRLLQDIPAAGSDIPLCQNRGTGIPTMLEALRQAQMSPPNFRDDIRAFKVTFPEASLFATETLEWLTQFKDGDLTEHHRTALALAHAHGEVTNASLRHSTGVDSRDAGPLLQGLTDRGFLIREGGKRWAKYRVAPDYQTRPPAQEELPLGGQSPGPLPSIGAELREVANYIGQHGQATRGDVERAFKLKASTAAYRLKRLRALGYVEYTGKAKSKDVGYRLTAIAQSAGAQASATS